MSPVSPVSPVSISPAISLQPAARLAIFADRHLGPDPAAVTAMAATLGFPSLEALVDAVVPAGIRAEPRGPLPEPLGEAEALAKLGTYAAENRVVRSCLGQGWSDCYVPAVIQRNVLENPGWYTQYTPYQAEISQGRLECLLVFQTLVCELTGLDIANASLLDEATACAEGVAMCQQDGRATVAVTADIHPQNLAVVRTRAEALGWKVAVIDAGATVVPADTFAVLIQYPGSDGRVRDPRPLITAAHAAGAKTVLAVDPLAACLLAPAGVLGADVAVGSLQRFGVPMGFGGPSAGFLATREAFKRQMPGRLVGVSKDRHGNAALRLSLQTREQHIRREKATSNICTAQALLANMAALYAMWHGPEGLTAIAAAVAARASRLAGLLAGAGLKAGGAPRFDTVRVDGVAADTVLVRALAAGFNLRRLSADAVAIALDETTTDAEVDALARAVAGRPLSASATVAEVPAALRRTGAFLPQPAFHRYRSETALMRHIKRLESRDLSLTTSMIPLGSCTMKLNAAAELLPITWPGFSRLHPFAPADQAVGYHALFRDLSAWLGTLTGLPGVSLQPNSGAQGEYAGLLAIRGYFAAKGETGRTIVLIPTSAHGTNPATASLAGLSVVAVACDAQGNVDLADLAAKAEANRAALCCLMVTYPSTHGVFEPGIAEACRIVHAAGGQVYMDGANMNAQVGLTSPGAIGADVCHLNLHKTFCIPHGGGGPGVGPICVAQHLIPHLPGDPGAGGDSPRSGHAVSAAPFGSAGILPIPWMYIAMMGLAGLKRATGVAILNANYIVGRLRAHYPVLYTGANGLVAHECIIDLRGFKTAGVEAEDVAKRLRDYGFHAPTLSFPVPGTLMIEPTESEDREELDRFCDALIAIRAEIAKVERGEWDRADNPLKMAPHTAVEVSADAWTHRYSREVAAYPVPGLRAHKFWPAVGRVDNPWGDRNLVCTCAGMETVSS